MITTGIQAIRTPALTRFSQNNGVAEPFKIDHPNVEKVFNLTQACYQLGVFNQIGEPLGSFGYLYGQDLILIQAGTLLPRTCLIDRQGTLYNPETRDPIHELPEEYFNSLNQFVTQIGQPNINLKNQHFNIISLV